MKIKLIALLILLSVTLVTCKKEGEETKDESTLNTEFSIREDKSNKIGNEYTLYPNAIFVKNDINSNVISLTPTEIIIKKIPRLDDILEGDILYSLGTEKFPNGYVVKLSNKVVEANVVKYKVKPVGFEEVFKTAKYDNTFVFAEPSTAMLFEPFEKRGSLDFFDPKRIIEGPKLEDNTFIFKYVFWDYDKNYEKTKYDQVIATLKVTALDSRMEFDFNGLVLSGKKAIYINAKPRFTAEISLSYDFSKSADSAITKKVKEAFNKVVTGQRIRITEIKLNQAHPSGFLVGLKLIPYVKVSASGSASVSLTAAYSEFGADFIISSHDALNPNSYTSNKYDIIKGKGSLAFEAEIEGSATLAPGIGIEAQLFDNFDALNKISDKENKAYLGAYLEWANTIKLKNKSSYLSNGQFCNDFEAGFVTALDANVEGRLTFLGKTPFEFTQKLFSYSFLDNYIPPFSYSYCTDKPNNPDDNGFNPYLNTDLSYGTVTDIDNNTYATIKIGNQTWMAENLKTTKYNDGTPILNIKSPDGWKTATSGAWTYFNNDESYNKYYGKLYNYYAVESNKLCPVGWHMPSQTEWNTLVNFLGGSPLAVGKLQSNTNIPNNILPWPMLTDSTKVTNLSGFTSLPGGKQSHQTGSSVERINGFWWSSTWTSSYGGMGLFMGYNGESSIVTQLSFDKEMGASIRCIKD